MEPPGGAFAGAAAVSTRHGTSPSATRRMRGGRAGRYSPERLPQDDRRRAQHFRALGDLLGRLTFDDPADPPKNPSTPSCCWHTERSTPDLGAGPSHASPLDRRRRPGIISATGQPRTGHGRPRTWTTATTPAPLLLVAGTAAASCRRASYAKATAATCAPKRSPNYLAELCDAHFLEEQAQGHFVRSEMVRIHAAQRVTAEEPRWAQDQALRRLLDHIARGRLSPN